MSAARRILMLSDLYPPVIGGLEAHVQSISLELARRGWDVSVATLAHPDAPSEETDRGVRIHRLQGWSRLLARFYEQRERPFHPTVPDPGFGRQLQALVDDVRPAILHAHSWAIYSALTLRRRPRVVMNLHDYGLVCAKKTLMRNGSLCSGPRLAKCLRCAAGHYGVPKAIGISGGLFASRRLHGRIDCFVAASTAVARATRRWTADRPIRVVPSCVPDECEELAGADARPSFLPPEDGYIMFVGALGRHKGLDVLLDAYRELAQKPPLVVVGTPQGDTPTFDRDVTVALNVPHGEVMAAWARASIAVVPSVWTEPFGKVAVEAMLAGRPVVASEVGGLADIVTPDTGVLVPPGDAAALRDALASLLVDPGRRAELGARARERARRFTASRVTAQLEDLYRELLEAPRPLETRCR
ncbi:MAG: glycosyltransferase family 4 protein [Actinomycetota bacterium]|nr:glycosyltransferase family 4 protein [Actinomycetota bacterium]